MMFSPCVLIYYFTIRGMDVVHCSFGGRMVLGRWTIRG